jgi:hypothetical protein
LEELIRRPLGYILTICVRVCLIKSIMPVFIILFAVVSDRENMCSGAYSSFLLIPRHLTPTVYTNSDARCIDIFGLSDGREVREGLEGLASGTVMGDGCLTFPTRWNTFLAFWSSCLSSVSSSVSFLPCYRNERTFHRLRLLLPGFLPVMFHLLHKIRIRR